VSDGSDGESGAMISRNRTAALRGLSYFVFWVLLMPSAKPEDLAVGAIAAALATHVSLRLLPPEAGRLRFISFVMLVPHFLWQSVLAGFDVARRVFDPKLPLNPGLVKFESGFPPGLARNTFASITSLLPGSVPTGVEADAIVYHALDVAQPVVDQLAEEERLFAPALIVGKSHA